MLCPCMLAFNRTIHPADAAAEEGEEEEEEEEAAPLFLTEIVVFKYRVDGRNNGSDRVCRVAFNCSSSSSNPINTVVRTPSNKEDK